MPLETVDPNVQTLHSHKRVLSKAASDVATRLPSIPPPPPSSVQRMLRTTTETGDIGLAFPSHPSLSPILNYSQSRRHRRNVSLASSTSASRCSERSRNKPHAYRRLHRSDFFTDANPPPNVRTSTDLLAREPLHPSAGHNKHTVLLRDRSNASRSLFNGEKVEGALSRTSQHWRELSYLPAPEATRRYGLTRSYTGQDRSLFLPKKRSHQSIVTLYRNQSVPDSSSSLSLATGLDSGSSALQHRNIPGTLLQSTPLRRTNFFPTVEQLGSTAWCKQSGLATKGQTLRLSNNRSPSQSIVPEYYDYSESFIDSCSSPEPWTKLNEQAEAEMTAKDGPQTASLLELPNPIKPVEMSLKHARCPSGKSTKGWAKRIPDRVSSLNFSTQVPMGFLCPEPDIRHLPKPSMFEHQHAGSNVDMLCRGDDNMNEHNASITAKAKSPSNSPSDGDCDNEIIMREETTSHLPSAYTALEHASNTTHRTKIYEASHRLVLHNSLEHRQSIPKACTSFGRSKSLSIIGSGTRRNSFCLTPQRSQSQCKQKQSSETLEPEGNLTKRPGSSFESVSLRNVLLPKQSPILASREETSELKNHKYAHSSETQKFRNAKTPVQSIRLSLLASHGKSTVESLLDKHIESLGLNPEPVSPSRDRTVHCRTLSSDHKDHCVETRLVSNCNDQQNLWRYSPSPGAATDLDQPLAIDQKAKMVPDPLFSDSHFKTLNLTPIELPSPIFELSIADLGRDGLSSAWQTLGSNSQCTSALPSGRASSMTQNMMNVDISKCPRRFKMRNRSHPTSSLSPSNHPSLRSIILRKSEFGHKRTKSELLAKQESHRRRRIRIRLKREKMTSSRPQQPPLETPVIDTTSKELITVQTTAEAADSLPHCLPAELSATEVCEATALSKGGQNTSLEFPCTVRFQKTGNLQTFPVHRTMSVGGRSYRSDRSLAEPVNSSRLQQRIQRSKAKIPQLDPPDLGPPLTTHEWDLSIPYASIPSTINPSLRETKSFFDLSPPRYQPKSIKGRFGLASLRSLILQPSYSALDGGSDAHNGTCSNFQQGLGPERNDGDGKDPKVRKHFSTCTEQTSRKNGLIVRILHWWKCHCMHHPSPTKKRRRTPTLPNGMSV